MTLIQRSGFVKFSIFKFEFGSRLNAIKLSFELFPLFPDYLQYQDVEKTNSFWVNHPLFLTFSEGFKILEETNEYEGNIFLVLEKG